MGTKIPREEAPWHDFRRVCRAVLVADVVESVRLLQEHEVDAIQRWRSFVSVLRGGVLAKYEARLVKSLGDGLLIDCEHPQRAVALAFELHDQMAAMNDGLEDARRILLRIGVHVTEVIEDELDVYGSGVNLAARITALARPGGVSASSATVDELLPGIDALVEDAGQCYLKHFAQPVQVFHLLPVDDAHAALPSPRQEPAPGAAPTGPVCLALVPLEVDAGDAAHKVIATLLGDMLLTQLASVQQVRVISHLSSEQFAIRGLPPERIAQLTKASYLITGRLHEVGARHLAVLSLVEARTGETVWAGRFHFDSRDLFAPDEGVTPAMAQQILERVVSDQLRRVASSSLPTLASETLQFAAVHLMHRQAKSDFERAHDLLEMLAERHPRAAAPHAWLAKWHVLRVTKGLVPESELAGDHALWHTRQALDRNPEFAMCMAMEAFALCHIKRDLAASSARLEAALALNPSEPWVWLVRTTVESLLGNGEAAWEAALMARSLSPMDPLKHYYDALAASAATSAERFEDARRLALLSLSKDSRHLPTLRALAISCVHLGDMPRAREAVKSVLTLSPDFTLENYIANAPRGGEDMRRKWAIALAEAGAP